MTTAVLQTEFLVYDRTLGVAAMDARGFYYPVGMAIRDDGRIFVQGRSHDGDTRGARITVLDYESRYYGDFGSYGSEDGQFIWPTDIALDSHGNLCVSDEYLQRVSVFDRDVKFTHKWGERGSQPGQIDGPSGIDFDVDDNLYVVDHNNHRVQKFTKDGEFLSSFGSNGGEPGQFDLPWGLRVAQNGHIYVADWRNDRIQQFTPDGEFVASYGESGGGEGQLNRPAAVEVDEQGYVYVADWGNERVQVFDPDGGFVQTLNGQATTSIWAQEFLDSNPDEDRARSSSDLEQYHLLRTDDPHEVASQIEPLFWSPTSVRIDPSGRLHVLERNRHRIQVFKKAEASSETSTNLRRHQ